MTIKETIIQTCDGCGEKRNIHSRQKATENDWVRVRNYKDLCPACIDDALGVNR